MVKVTPIGKSTALRFFHQILVEDSEENIYTISFRSDDEGVEEDSVMLLDAGSYYPIEKYGTIALEVLNRVAELKFSDNGGTILLD